MNLQQAMSFLRHAFPELKNHQRESPTWRGTFCTAIIDEHGVARLIAKEVARGNSHDVQMVFDGIEELLCSGEGPVRDWVRALIEAVQDVAGWTSQGQNAFLWFLGPETRRAWVALDAIRADLAECSILEAEVTMWRAVHRTQAGPRAA